MQQPPALETIAPPLPRFAAAFIDFFLMFPVNVTVIEAVTGEFPPENNRAEAFVIPIITQGIYYILFHSFYGATFGKMALRLRVVRADGQPLLPDTVILRFLVFVLGNMALGAGFFASLAMIVVDPQRRSLHDRVAGTVVVIVPRSDEINPWRREPPPDRPAPGSRSAPDDEGKT
jgi:uncharacterized RDD family membrane protein YckC